jgi:hypothetical protein
MRLKRRKYLELFLILGLLLVSCQQKPANNNSDELIAPTDVIDLTNLELFWQSDISFELEDNATLSIYVRANKDENGELLFDDGQDWSLILESSLGKYALFPRQYVQLGRVSCLAFLDSDHILHVLVTVLQGAGYMMYDCVYEKETRVFVKRTVYEVPSINVQAISE